MEALIVILVLVGLAWVVIALPARRRQRAHQAMQDGVEAGDEIITAGGMHAVVREAGDEELRIEIAPAVVVTLDRRAVAAVAVEVGDDDDPDAVGAGSPQPAAAAGDTAAAGAEPSHGQTAS